MTEIARLELGRRRANGTCEVAVVDAQGHRHQGVLTDPELVDDYLDYLDSAGLDRPAVTVIGPAEPAPPSRAPVQPHQPAVPIPVSKLARLVATAARAPSVHNTQPWRFRASRHTIDLLAARVRFGAAAPIGSAERQMLTAMPYRHTHRGPFTADPVPRSLLSGLQHDVMVEGCTLVLVDRPGRYQQLSALVTAADHQQHTNPAVRAELRRWTRPQGSPARDGVPAYAYPPASAPVAGKLAQRDFDLGRHLGLLEGGGSPPAATGILITPAESKADWLRAGQALHRLLLHAATQWVFASLHTQPLESPPARAKIMARLALPGPPQMVLQLGHGDSAAATARRPTDDILT